jgi:hypothetical protein
MDGLEVGAGGCIYRERVEVEWRGQREQGKEGKLTKLWWVVTG